jgi:hypothetical protein
MKPNAVNDEAWFWGNYLWNLCDIARSGTDVLNLRRRIVQTSFRIEPVCVTLSLSFFNAVQITSIWRYRTRNASLAAEAQIHGMR